MSKYTTETATLKALVIDTNVLKINGFVFKPTQDGLTLTPPTPEVPDDQEIEDDQTTGGDNTGDSSTQESTGGNMIIGGGTGSGVVIGGGVTNNIVNETTIIKEQKLKTIQYTIAQYKAGISNAVYTCQMDDTNNIIVVTLLQEGAKTYNDWTIEKVLIKGRQILCPIYQSGSGWAIQFAQSEDKYSQIFGGISDDTVIKIFLTYTEPLETTVTKPQETNE